MGQTWKNKNKFILNIWRLTINQNFKNGFIKLTHQKAFYTYNGTSKNTVVKCVFFNV